MGAAAGRRRRQGLPGPQQVWRGDARCARIGNMQRGVEASRGDAGMQEHKAKQEGWSGSRRAPPLSWRSGAGAPCGEWWVLGWARPQVPPPHPSHC